MSVIKKWVYVHKIKTERIIDHGNAKVTPCQAPCDIKNDKIRTKFAKMLRAQGAVRLQFSVYEVNNTQRIIENIKINIVDKFSKLFTGADSVLIFDAPDAKVQKFGNAIHRDADIVYL